MGTDGNGALRRTAFTYRFCRTCVVSSPPSLSVSQYRHHNIGSGFARASFVPFRWYRTSSIVPMEQVPHPSVPRKIQIHGTGSGQPDHLSSNFKYRMSIIGYIIFRLDHYIMGSSFSTDSSAIRICMV